MVKNLVIFGNDHNYNINLAQALAESNLFSYQIKVINDLDLLSEIETEVLLTDDVVEKPAKYCFYLKENNTNEEFHIYKYQPVKGIINKILEIIGMESINLGEERLKITGVYSRQRAVYMNKLAENYIKDLSGISLCINLDYIFNKENCNLDISTIMYYLETDVEKLKLLLLNENAVDGVLYINAASNISQLYFLKEWKKLIKIIKNVGRFNELIIKLPTILDGLEDLVVEIENILYPISLEDSIYDRKFIQSSRFSFRECPFNEKLFTEVEDELYAETYRVSF